MLSYQALGIALTRNDPEALRLAAGISLYSTLQQARNQVARLPPERRGFVAELRIPEDAPVTIERTGKRGHHTLWGSADVILDYVSWVMKQAQERHDEDLCAVGAPNEQLGPRLR